MDGVNRWLGAQKHRISRLLLWLLLGGILTAVVGMYAERQVDWHGAKVKKAYGALVALNETGAGFVARIDGADKVFFCTDNHPFCRVLSGYENRHDGAGNSKALKADLEYLTVDEGNVLLFAAFEDKQTGERVAQRLSQNMVDEQAAMVERHAGGWHLLPVYLRQVFFTAFFLLLLVRLYVFIVEKLNLRRMKRSNEM
ncbi:MAG: hypothetical protein Q4A84_04635 [Neisseria sp.]|uniref:hypothetical protein n=1 Tax=Neisseria sp. TaxID=192066 RepID=UPI0026DBAB12|nr:hypothetical protein [Neisseria sp.]MDO4640976.1 hypothetical protein [Neisseria sp.]